MKPSLEPLSGPLKCPRRGNFFTYSSCPLIILYSHYLSNMSVSSQTRDSLWVWSVVLLFSLPRRAPGSNVPLQIMNEYKWTSEWQMSRWIKSQKKQRSYKSPQKHDFKIYVMPTTFNLVVWSSICTILFYVNGGNNCVQTSLVLNFPVLPWGIYEIKGEVDTSFCCVSVHLIFPRGEYLTTD